MSGYFRVTTFVVMVTLLFFSILLARESSETREEVLLVYSSGEPVVWSELKKNPGIYETITSPTPKKRNVFLIARHICENLKQKGIGVRLARAENFAKEDWKEVYSYQTIVLGTPARFWNLSWEMKRFLEDIFIRIYALTENRAKGKVIAAFALAEIMPSSEKALDGMSGTISDNRASLALRLSLSLNMSEEEYTEEIKKFCNSLAILAK